MIRQGPPQIKFGWSRLLGLRCLCSIHLLHFHGVIRRLRPRSTGLLLQGSPPGVSINGDAVRFHVLVLLDKNGSAPGIAFPRFACLWP